VRETGNDPARTKRKMSASSRRR